MWDRAGGASPDLSPRRNPSGRRPLQRPGAGLEGPLPASLGQVQALLETGLCAGPGLQSLWRLPGPGQRQGPGAGLQDGAHHGGAAVAAGQTGAAGLAARQASTPQASVGAPETAPLVGLGRLAPRAGSPETLLLLQPGPGGHAVARLQRLLDPADLPPPPPHQPERGADVQGVGVRPPRPPVRVLQLRGQ